MFLSCTKIAGGIYMTAMRSRTSRIRKFKNWGKIKASSEQRGEMFAYSRIRQKDDEKITKRLSSGKEMQREIP